MNSILSILGRRPIVFDGAMGTMIQKALSTECNEALNISRPDIILSIHKAYLEAGADVITTNTFGASSIALAGYKLAHKVEEINTAAVKIARQAVQSCAAKKKFVAGELGPTSKLPTLGHISFNELFESYQRQVSILIENGVDCLIISTCQDPLQMKAALSASVARGVPVLVSVTIEKNGTMLLGTDILAALATAAPFKPDAFGINCAVGPQMMEAYIHELALHSPFPIICRPNAGIPENKDGKPYYPLTPSDFADRLKTFVDEFNAAIIGGCCGTTPEHIGALAREVKGKTRHPPQVSGLKSQVSSLFSSVSLVQEPRPFLIAEQTNVNGSKKFKELLLKDDYDGMAAMARQAAKGAHALDICVAYPGRNEVRDMVETVSRIVRTVDSPVVIDSTNVAAIEAALKIAPGRCIINSINLEDGGAKAEKILGFAKKFGATLICLTIDENGMAKTAAEKLKVARRLCNLAISHGLGGEDLLFDALTFTVASGDAALCDAATQTIEGLKGIKKKIKGARTVLGVSNISYGLSPRARSIVTSLFLNKAIKAGLDAAIVNPARILRLSEIPKVEEVLATRLLENDNSKGNALNQLLVYYGKGRMDTVRLKRSHAPYGAWRSRRVEVRIEDILHQKILGGDKTGIEELLEKAAKDKGASDVIEKILLPAMQEVGELLGKGKLPLPFVLESAEVMRTAIDILTPRLKKGKTMRKGTIILATVRGDVHDIGKNLAGIILSNNGFEVIDLGTRQPIGAVLEAAKSYKADAIGLSGLLVSSTEVMREDLEMLKNQGIEIPTLVGGAALTHNFVKNTLKKVYDGPLFYCEDAFAGLKAMQEVVKK